MTSPLRLAAVPLLGVALLLASCSSDEGGTTVTSADSSTTVDTSSSTTGSAEDAAGVERASAESETAIAYADASPTETLDLYLPESDGTAPVPVVVLLHPGAFQGGDSSMEATYAEALVDRGIAAAAVNYRLSGEATFPAGAQDVKAAVRWLRANAATYGLDPDHVGAWGQSAGGWFANLLGATGDQATVFDDDALGNAEESSAVQAVVSWFGPTDFATMDEQAAETNCPAGQAQVHGTADSPESVWLGEAVDSSPTTEQTDIAAYVADAEVLPPWYLAHGDSDCLVPGGQSAELSDALDAAGAEVTYTELAGAGHMDPAFDSTQLTPTLDFLEQALAS